jgi:hypothetical protein
MLKGLNGALRMDKTCVAAVIVCTVFVFSLISSPIVFVQAAYTGVTVLSHSSYVNSSGHFIVVGEVQNTGNHVLGNVSLDVVVSASNGSQLVSGTTMAYVNDFLPQQKAPFYLDFGKIDFDIISEVSTFDFNVSNHPPTNYIEYPGLSLVVTFNGIANDVYVVSGSITNSGSQTANDIKVVGTYYNSEGIVVAVGLVILNGPLIPNKSVNFAVNEFDASPKLVNRISNYSLLVQTSTQQLNLPSSASPTPSTASSGSSWLVYVGISAVVIVVFAFSALVFLRKHKASRKVTR